MSAQIEESAYLEAKRQADGSSVVVGVNRFQEGSGEEPPVLEVDKSLEEAQRSRLVAWRAERSKSDIDAALTAVETGAASDMNLLHPIRDALATGATLGEVSDALRSVFGTHKPG